MKLKYVVAFERTPNNWCAYAPDVLGCVSTGDTWEEMLEMIQEALTFHIESMLEDGDPVPEAIMSIEEAIAYHLELASEDIREILPDLDDFPPTVATRFEPVEIEIRVLEPVRGIPEPPRWAEFRGPTPMRLTYTVVFVLDANGWGAYVPDVPGCVSVGDTWEEVLEMMGEALTFHMEGTLEDGALLPEPKTSIEDAVTYHLELGDDDLGDLGLDIGDPPPTLATRFEPVEIEVRVLEPAQSSGAPRSAPVPAR